MDDDGALVKVMPLLSTFITPSLLFGTLYCSARLLSRSRRQNTTTITTAIKPRLPTTRTLVRAKFFFAELSLLLTKNGGAVTMTEGQGLAQAQAPIRLGAQGQAPIPLELAQGSLDTCDAAHRVYASHPCRLPSKTPRLPYDRP